MQESIGKYQILERLGKGGQGTVYRARDTELNRIVAIKIIDQPVAEEPAYGEALGHSNVGITLDIYSHCLPNMKEEHINLIASLLKVEG